VITVWGLIYVYSVTGTLLAMTSSMMVLLGIAGTGSVLARWIAPDISSPVTAATNQPGARTSKPFEFWQMLSTNGNFDLLKLQLFVFTLMIGVYIVWRIADTAAFPEIDTNTLLLLGVSQGVYIGGKLGGTSLLSHAQAIKLDLDLRMGERKDKNDEKRRLEQRQEVLNNKKTRSPLEKHEDDELSDIPGLLKTNDEKTKEIEKRIAELQEQLNKALIELGLSVK
jgi:hypothetical protein